MPLVPAEITYSRFLNQLAPEGPELVEAVIRFTYTLDGNQFESDTPVLKGYEIFPNRSYERQLTKKYKKGDVVNARVIATSNPIAYLEIAPLSWFSTITAPVFILLGVGGTIAFFNGYLDPVFVDLKNTISDIHWQLKYGS